jgi:phage gpG-like protein
VRLTFEILGDKVVDRDLIRIGARITDARPALEAVATLMMSETGEQFDSQGARASGGWAPLKPATILSKRARGLEDPERILYATGALLRALTQRDDPNQLLEVHEDELLYGTTLPYAAFHQTGTRKMPQRRPVEFTEDTRREIVKLVQRFALTGEVIG